MNVIGVNGVNNNNSNQCCKKNSHKQNFGQLIFTTPAARDTFAKKITQMAAETEIPAALEEGWRILLHQHVDKKPECGTLITDAEKKLEVRDAQGELIHRTEIGKTQPEETFIKLFVDSIRKITGAPMHEDPEIAPEKLIQQCAVQPAEG